MDLGRSSHIHITTWGTLSRQKKGQRSKGTEGASIISLSIALSNKSYLLFKVYRFLFILPWCSRLVSVPALLYQIFFFFFLFSFEAWRRPPPAATEDNYTNTDKSASTVTHSRVGVLPYATSYRLQRLCKTEKKTGKSGAGHKGERCAESRRDRGRWKEEGGSDHLAHRASHLDTLRSEKITQVC